MLLCVPEFTWPAMSSLSELCLSNSPSSSFPCCVKNRFDLESGSNPVLHAATARKGYMGKVRKGIEPVKLTNALPLFDGIPKPTNGSTIVFHFAEHMTNHEKGVRKISDFTENDTPSDIIQGQLCSSSASIVTDRHYIITVLSFCSRVGSLEIGRRCHALITKTGLGGDKFISTSLIDMYAKCGEMENAAILFDKMARLDIASCNCLISGYARNGLLDQAFEFFVNIGSMGMRPNHYTYSIMLTVCRTLSAIQEGKQLHAHIVKLQYLSETAVGNALLTMYSKFGMVEEAEFLFESLAERNLISWTAIITGFYQHGAFDKALRHFHLMIKSGIKPNEYTFTIVLVSCGSMKDLVNGRIVHAQVIKKGMVSGVFVGTAIINMYAELGEMDNAERQFAEMGKKASDVSWNALIAGYVRNEKTKEAMEAFHKMIKNDTACNEFTFSNILKACSSLPSLATCEQIHSRVIKVQIEANMHVGSSLIEAYANCGSLEDAERVFNRITDPDAVTCNSMIKAYSQNGYPTKAIFLLRKMVERGKKPTGSTFLAVLSACSHSGLVQEGQEFFQSMVRDYGIPPEQTHYSCMVDLLGRAGLLENALDFITNLPIKPTASIWRPLLAACRCNGNLQLAEYVAKHILDLDPDDATVYITLSNMYAELGRLVDAEEQRKQMELKGVSKEPGCSWIEVNNRIYKFFSHDKTHPEMPKVYDGLNRLMKQIKDIGYTPITNLVLHPQLGQVKEEMILYHSEKLAVCFGIMNLPPGKPIRVFKNLRVCADCHSTMKYIARITERDIVLRDNYRFHYFKQGCCSCGDYW